MSIVYELRVERQAAMQPTSVMTGLQTGKIGVDKEERVRGGSRAKG